MFANSEKNHEIIVIKYKLLTIMINKCCSDYDDNEATKLKRSFEYIKNQIPKLNLDNDVCKAEIYNNCIEYAKKLNNAEEDPIAFCIDLIENNIIPSYLSLEQAKIRFAEALEDYNIPDSSTLKQRL